MKGTFTSPQELSRDTAANSMHYQEANLVMHYFDHVFPLQYSNLSPWSSRGWLLWLLMKNKSLHQAVLSLAALHQSAVDSSLDEQKANRLIASHALALEGLHQFLGASMCQGPLIKAASGRTTGLWHVVDQF